MSPLYRTKPIEKSIITCRVTPLIIGVLAFLLSCGSDSIVGSGLPQDPSEAGDGQLATVLESVRKAHGLPSLGAMSVVGEEIVEMAAVGLRAVGGAEQVTTEDRWHIGSLTKAMTATLAARLVEQGVLSWDSTVSDIFPDLVGSIRPEYEEVTLQDLLHHTGGLISDVRQTPSWPSLRTNPDPLPAQRRQWTAEFLAKKPETDRGSYLYSNAGYVVAGTMLEEMTGSSWEELMQRELLTPLGMSSTGFGPPGTAAVLDEPRAHVRSGNSWKAIEPGPLADNPLALGPAGTVHTTFSDYAKYLMAHLAGARGDGGLVSAASFETLHQPAPGTSYALGWGVGQRSWAGGQVLQHSGSNTMWFATVWIAPERNLAMLAVTNAGGDSASRGTDTAIQALIERFEAAFGED